MTKLTKKSKPKVQTLADIEIEEEIVVDKTPRNADLREKKKSNRRLETTE